VLLFRSGNHVSRFILPVFQLAVVILVLFIGFVLRPHFHWIYVGSFRHLHTTIIVPSASVGVEIRAD
jgi:hypothetical protein